MANLMTALSEAELDIAFVRLPCESSKAFNLRIIDEEPMVIALPRDNPLATQPTLALEQRARRGADPLPAGGGPGLYELVYNSCLRAGIDMERAWQSSQISSSLSMVNAGFGFALVPQSMTCIQQPNVSYHPLSGAPLKTDIAIAWRRFERSRTVKRFWRCSDLRGASGLLRHPAAIHVPCGAAHLGGGVAAQKQRHFAQLLRGDKLPEGCFSASCCALACSGSTPRRCAYRSAAAPARLAPSPGRWRCR